MSPKWGAVSSSRRDSACELDDSEDGSIHESEKFLHLQEGPAAAVPHLPGAQEASWHQQGDATCERAVSADVENGFCTRDGSVREPLDPQGKSATNNEPKTIFRRFLGERFRCHPVGTAVLILLLLPLPWVIQWTVPSAAPQVPVTPATSPSPSLLGCRTGWFLYRGVCYCFSLGNSTWEKDQEWCSELGASLAIAKEEAMDWLFSLCGNGDFWLGLRRRGERLHWGDGSSYSSRVPVLGNSQCVYLADERFRSENCSNLQLYLCSKAQAPL